MNNRGKEGEPVRKIRSIPGFIDVLDTRKAFHDSPSVVERVRRFIKPPKMKYFLRKIGNHSIVDNGQGIAECI